MAELHRVGVVGGGLMGSGIAQVSALAGFDTMVCEVDAASAERARVALDRGFAKGVERGKIPADEAAAARARVSVTTKLAELGDRELIIEAIVEALDAKRALWVQLDSITPAPCIFASNTSSLSIADQAAATRRGDRFVGMHFFSPVPAMPLVEVVRTVTTSDATLDVALGMVRALGKEAIVARDTPGFIVNLLLVPYMIDAVRALERGVASVRDIDLGMRLGAGHPTGPLALCDYVGLDTLERVAGVMYDAFKEPRYAPPPLLHRMVVSGWLGRKSGLGFYDHREDPPVARALSG